MVNGKNVLPGKTCCLVVLRGRKDIVCWTSCAEDIVSCLPSLQVLTTSPYKDRAGAGRPRPACLLASFGPHQTEGPSMADLPTEACAKKNECESFCRSTLVSCPSVFRTGNGKGKGRPHGPFEPIKRSLEGHRGRVMQNRSALIGRQIKSFLNCSQPDGTSNGSLLGSCFLGRFWRQYVVLVEDF